jgi:hypothetical protein
MADENSKKKESRSFTARLRIIAGAITIAIAIIAGFATVVWYRDGTSGAYVLPRDWGRITILVPPQAHNCAAGIAMQYDESQSAELAVKISGLAHQKYGPVIGIIFDGSAAPPDSPWPDSFGSLKTSGDLPSAPWAEYAFPFGAYFGTAWLFRLAKVDHSFQFNASYPGTEVGDGKPLSIVGEVANKNGVDSLTLTIRLAGQFRIENGGRITYQPPLLEDFTALPDLSDPTELRDISNNMPNPPISKACMGGDNRSTLIYDTQSINPDGTVNPVYEVDSAEPTPIQSDELLWQTQERGEELSPVASVVSRQVVAHQQDQMFLAAGALAVTLAFAPLGLAQMPWPALERRRKRKRHQKLALTAYCIYVLHKPIDLPERERTGDLHTLRQRRPWTTGRKLWLEAKESDKHMPVIFSADNSGEVNYWGLIEEITIDEDTHETICAYSAIRPITPPRQTSELRLRSGGQHIAARLGSYAICYTPEFLN